MGMVLGVKAFMVNRNSTDCFDLGGISLNLSKG
jgi:hypothetical protein